ncbi:hypothetical protein HPB52_017469 [Rhipicephalus sanguineus]|uniref:Uncharacterized protein n=1 Tax=Rhipicephalus sanguineus TaxID=34632 RepID=A0A9D4SRQ3_RHISA|nr:hypothetical protein HPB52_017469 [Rhipicephalus sanguineus]
MHGSHSYPALAANVSFTTAEFVGLHVAVELLVEELPSTPVAVYWCGLPGVLHWLPAQFGAPGNDEAGRLAMNAHVTNATLSIDVMAGEFTRHGVWHYLQARLQTGGWHSYTLVGPSPPVGLGNLPSLLFLRLSGSFRRVFRYIGLPSTRPEDLLPRMRQSPTIQNLVELPDWTVLSSNLDDKVCRRLFEDCRGPPAHVWPSRSLSLD